MHLLLNVSNITVNGLAVDVEQGFLPWLMDRVEAQLNQAVLGRTVLDHLIREVVQQRREQYRALEDDLKAESPADKDAMLNQALEEEFKPLEVSELIIFV